MTTFRIRNAISKATLGDFEAGTTAQALDQLAQAGGWDSFAALTRDVPWAAGGVIVEELAEAVRPTQRSGKHRSGRASSERHTDEHSMA